MLQTSVNVLTFPVPQTGVCPVAVEVRSRAAPGSRGNHPLALKLRADVLIEKRPYGRCRSCSCGRSDPGIVAIDAERRSKLCLAAFVVSARISQSDPAQSMATRRLLHTSVKGIVRSLGRRP